MSEDFKTHLMADKDKVDLDSRDFFDKVINLKLYVANADGTLKDTYVIRSDYETYFPKLMESVSAGDYRSFASLNKCVIRKCQQKPSIKVQYKRVSLTASVEVDIFVSNFNMLDKNGDLIAGFNNETYKLSRVDFAMGYFGQFKSLFAEQGPQTAEQLVTMGFVDDSNPRDYSNPNIGHGITVMTMSNVEYSQLDKLPPDMVLHIHGYVGNTLAPLSLAEFDSERFPKSYDKLMQSVAVVPSELKSGMDSYIGQVFFEEVTRWWVKKGTPTKLRSAEVKEGKDFTTGAMSEEDANKWGIKVYLSNGVKKFSEKKVEGFQKDADGNPIKPNVKFPSGNTALATIQKIANNLQIPNFTHVFIESFGDYIVCLKEELNDVKGMIAGTKLSEYYENTALKKSWNNCIPAVYNITNDALCTIVCPFFSFINPFEKLKFKSRYALGGLVSYFANFTNANRDEFYALWQNVSFATVEDVNECMIVCTGERRS